MRPFKLAGMMFVLALLVSAFASTSAFAALEFLDGTVTGLTFTGKGGKTELLDPTNGVSMNCEKSTILLPTSKVIGPKTIEITGIHLEKCKESIFSTPVNSLGDSSGIILVPLKGELCYFDKAETEAALLLKIPPLHYENPTLGQLSEIIKNGPVDSAVIAKLAKGQQNTLKTGPYTLEFIKGSQRECFLKGAKKVDIEVEDNHDGKPLLVEQAGSLELTFDQDIEIMA